GHGAAKRLGGTVDVEIGNGGDDPGEVDRGHEIFADAALGEAAVELDVIDVADDDDLGACIADLGETVELVFEPIARELRFDDDEIRGRRRLIELGGGHDAAGLHLDVGPGHAAVAG